MLRSARHRVRALALLVGVALAAALFAGVPAGASSSSALSGVQARLQHVQSALNAAHASAAQLAQRLAAVSTQLERARHELALARGRVAVAKARSVSSAHALERADAQVGARLAAVDTDARAAYIAGDFPTALAALAQSSNVNDLVNGMATLNFVAEQDQQQVAQLQAARAFATEVATLHRAAVQAAESAAAAQRQQVTRLAALQHARRKAAAAFTARINTLAHEAASLRARSTELQGLITSEQSLQVSQVSSHPQPTVSVPAGAVNGVCDLSGASSAERWIIMHESGGRPTAQNPYTSAFGLGQLLLGNRVRFLGANYATTNCALQLQAFRDYVAERYGNAEAAMAFWEAHGWY